MKLEKRYSQNYQYTLSYTFTDADDNAPMARYLDPFDFDSTGDRRTASAAMPSWPADRSCCRGTSTSGRCGRIAPQLPWSAGAGRDLNGDRFTSDLVPGTTRNSGSRDLNLDAVNVYRASLGLAPIDASTIDSSRINIMDIRVSKRIRFGGDRVWS